MKFSKSKDLMNIVITGHVDHGKSTLVGRLLADTESLPEGKLASVKESCKKNGRVFEYAFLLDALEDEQKQGITIDSARIFFKSAVREYIIIDAPGHIEFLRNMLSGASRASAAVLVIDAVEGVAENSLRHGLLLSLLGISQVLVAVNKLDALNYEQAVFERIKAEYSAYLESLKVKPLAFIPVSAREGKNITERAVEMPWYTGQTVLDALDSLRNLGDESGAFFAMPLQDVYRFSADNDERRIYAGTIVSGELRAGERVRFLPSEKEARVKQIEAWNVAEKSVVGSGEAAGFTFEEEIYVRNGEIMVKAGEASPVVIGDTLRANVIWLGQKPLLSGKDYTLKLGAAKVSARLERIERLLGDAERAGSNELRRHECGAVVLTLFQPIACTTFQDNPALGRFVIVDGYDAVAGGIVSENLGIKRAWESLASLEGLSPDTFEEELFTLLKKHFPHRFR
jgi:bifunctional enzyme CysN/CysC/sulfate adenylyltransferase subunit 1